MGTCNFVSNNTSCIYAVSTSYYDDNIEKEVQDEYIYDDTVYNIIYDLKSKFDITKKSDYGNDRNFSGTIFATVNLDTIYYYDLGIDITIDLIARSGYYSGFNLDFDINYTTDYISNTEAFDEDELWENIYWYLTDNKPSLMGLAKYHYDSFYKRLQKQLNTTITIIESTYADYSSPLQVAARFSNGETMYSKCSK